jgi:hypothetical protein
MTNLTTTQKNILATAALLNGSIYPLPPNLKGGAATKVVDALRAKNLIDSDGMITEMGRNAVDPDRQNKLDNDAFAASMGRGIPAEAPATADEPPTHGPGPDFSDDAVAQAWSDNMPAEDAAYHAEMNAASEEPDGPDDYDNPPIGIIVPMDPADLPQANADEAPPADADFEEDVIIAEQSVAQATDTVAEIIKDIAKQHLKFEGDLVNFYGNDGFMSAGFPWDSIRQALFAAYQAGLNATKSPRKKASPQARVKTPRENTKQAQVIALLKRPEGATIEQITEATDWNSNTARGVLAGALKKRLGLNVVRMPHNAGEKSSYRIED